MRPARFALLATLLYSTLAAAAASSPEQAREIVDRWLERQSGIETWSADVVQIRRIRSLARPLEARGKVWFRQPNRFRWQLGDPPRTIAVRTRDELVLMYPALKSAERFSLGEGIAPEWRQALALLEVGFPSDRETFYAGYQPLSAERAGDSWRLRLRPSGEQVRRLVEEVRFEVDAEDYTLRATELVFPDGSTMRNEFSNHEIDPQLDETLFEARLGDDWKVSRPLGTDD